MLKLIECPRDAMQGLHTFIPTENKINYLNQLLQVGFDTLDCGSFVSPKAIPQMADIKEVISKLKIENSSTKLLVIVANLRGAQQACEEEKVSYIGYPFSLSETFQQRNTNKSMADAYNEIVEIASLAGKNNKEIVLYFSMGFGNPYGDEWNAKFVEEWLVKFKAAGIKIFSLSDTVGTAKPEDISTIFSELITNYPELEIGAHFHSTAENQYAKIEAAYNAGCRRFDSAMLGFGGCPMAKDDLVGNIDTVFLKHFFDTIYMENTNLDETEFEKAREMASKLFGQFS
ncbi:MAG: hydroxymethylglutaryl-CoA lyase [Flavobacterium sp.]|nr:MAG: hydroxymethylglutaryl-CoA lyase [Flavobacterium sp.]